MTSLSTLLVLPAIVAKLEVYAARTGSELAPNTLRALTSDLRRYLAWCQEQKVQALPATGTTVVAFMNAMGKLYKPSTVTRFTASISTLHRAANYPSPITDGKVKTALAITRKQQSLSCQQTKGLNWKKLDQILARIPNDLRGLRDAALLCTAYDTLCRPSELLSVQIDDVLRFDDGTGAVYLRSNKFQREQQVRYLASSTVNRLEAWRNASKINDGPCFRSILGNERVQLAVFSARGVTRMLQRRLEKAGLSAEGFSGSSTRVGAAQDLVEANVSLLTVMNTGGWSSAVMPMRYTQEQAKERNVRVQGMAILAQRQCR